MFRVNALRRFSSVPSITRHKDHLEINEKIQVSFAWLRDQCKNPEFFDVRNHQKKFEYPTTTEVTQIDCNENELILNWKDGIRSIYKFQDLNHIFSETEEKFIQAQPWTSENFPDPNVDFGAFMTTDQGLKQALENICLHGFCFISDSPVSTEKGTKVVANRIGPIYMSTYGEYWELASKPVEHASDGSYGNAAIEPHTDTSYLNPVIGIQLFHCLQASECGGGQTILLDGFQLAEDYKKLNPQGFEFLSTYPVRAQYRHTVSEPQANYINDDVVFKLYPGTQDLNQVRINAYRFFPERMDLPSQLAFYKYFPQIIDMTKSAEYAKKFTLEPGKILLADNWRLLHGRTGFNGSRILSGCYLGRIDFMSRCRSLGIPVRD